VGLMAIDGWRFNVGYVVQIGIYFLPLSCIFVDMEYPKDQMEFDKIFIKEDNCIQYLIDVKFPLLAV
jgi:hypothetical protein